MEQLIHDVMSLYGMTYIQALEFISQNKDNIEQIIEEEKLSV